jgi:hypothetical protein
MATLDDCREHGKQKVNENPSMGRKVFEIVICAGNCESDARVEHGKRPCGVPF